MPTQQTHPWNKDRIIGQKRPLQISHIWGIRIRLELEQKVRDLALFNLGLDSKLRGCDLVKLKVSDVACGRSLLSRIHVVQQKTGCSVQFSSKSPKVLENRYWLGSSKQIYQSQITFLNRGSLVADTSQPGNTIGSFIAGLKNWA